MKRLAYLTVTGPAFGDNVRRRTTTQRRIYVTTTPQFRIRGIDPKVWARFIARLAADNVKPGEFFFRAIHRYADGDTTLELPPKSEIVATNKRDR